MKHYHEGPLADEFETMNDKRKAYDRRGERNIMYVGTSRDARRMKRLENDYRNDEFGSKGHDYRRGANDSEFGSRHFDNAGLDQHIAQQKQQIKDRLGRR